jgi:Asp/Glu/hydantoin racemase
MPWNLAFLHTSPAAIPPLSAYYKENAPEFRVTNLLDDGILHCFAESDEPGAESRLLALLQHARRFAHIDLALVTCSAVSRDLIRRLSSSAAIPVLKIDDALAEQAIASGPRLGVIVTFPPSEAAALQLLRQTAANAKKQVEIESVVLPAAYEALLGGRPEVHDELLLEAIAGLRAKEVDAVVLSQVSMARILAKVPSQGAPVLSSLPASLLAIRESLER